MGSNAPKRRWSRAPEWSDQPRVPRAPEGGDHGVAQKTHYVGTVKLLTRWLPCSESKPRMSTRPTLGNFDAAIRPNTRLLYAETPVNPTLALTDLAAVAALGRSRGIRTCVDNTFATPHNQRPIELGIDLVVHSATKIYPATATSRPARSWAPATRSTACGRR